MDELNPEFANAMRKLFRSLVKRRLSRAANGLLADVLEVVAKLDHTRTLGDADEVFDVVKSEIAGLLPDVLGEYDPDGKVASALRRGDPRCFKVERVPKVVGGGKVEIPG